MKQEGNNQFDRESQRTQQLKQIREGLPLIKTPLEPCDIRHLCRCIYRKQITIEMLSKEVFDELQETNLYKDLIINIIS